MTRPNDHWYKIKKRLSAFEEIQNEQWQQQQDFKTMVTKHQTLSLDFPKSEILVMRLESLKVLYCIAACSQNNVRHLDSTLHTYYINVNCTILYVHDKMQNYFTHPSDITTSYFLHNIVH